MGARLGEAGTAWLVSGQSLAPGLGGLVESLDGPAKYLGLVQLN